MTLSPGLLEQLREAGLVIEPHSFHVNEWYAGTVTVEGLGGGDVGPFDSAEGALIAGVRWLVHTADTAQHERDAAIAVLSKMREEVEQVEVLRRALQAAQAELRAEREAKQR
jgi:hypothetical protein